jgi:hypothetical protein
MKHTLTAITEVLAAIETLKAEVIRLQTEVVALERTNHEDSFNFIREEIMQRALDAVYFDEDSLVTLEIDQSGLRAEMYVELDSDGAKEAMSQAISDAFYLLKEDMEREERNPSVTDED